MIVNKKLSIGYVRTSTNSQINGIDVQLAAINPYQPNKIFIEQESGKNVHRKELNKALNLLYESPVEDKILIIYKIDRLGRTVRQLVEIENELREQNIKLLIVKENIDTSTPTGRLIFNILASVAEMEAEMISSRTKEALAILKQNGKKLGNKGISSEIETEIVDLYSQNRLSINEIATKTGVSSRTVSNVANRNNLNRRRK